MASGSANPIRLINTKLNPYWGMLGGAPQSSLFIHGQTNPPGLEGGRPAWIPLEFGAVAAYDTADSILNLPAGFVLLSLLEFSNQAANFAIQIYDVVAESWLTDKLADARLLCGQGAAPLIDNSPWQFEGDEPQVFVRVVNQAVVTADIMIALFGVIIPQGGLQ